MHPLIRVTAGPLGALVMSAFATCVCAADSITVPEEGPWWESTHDVMSEKVGEWSNNLDTYFSGQRHSNTSESSVAMRFGTIIEKQDGVSGFFNLDAKVHLPYTEDRLDLIIESDADELTQDNRITDNEPGQNILQSAQNTRFATMLRYFKEEWQANIDVGLLVRMPMDPFARITFDQDWRLGNWQFVQDQSVFTYYTLGNGVRYSIGAVRPVAERFKFGAEFGVTYLESDSEAYWRENIYLSHALSDISNIRYQFSYLQTGSSPHAESFVYFFEYQRLLHDNWLIGHFKPQVIYKRENDYQPDLTISASLEVLLGAGYL